MTKHIFESLNLRWGRVRPTRVSLKSCGNRRFSIGVPSAVQSRVVVSAAGNQRKNKNEWREFHSVRMMPNS